MNLTNALRSNTAFSFATGILLALVPGTVGDWLGVSIDGWLRLLGLSLLGHAALLGWASQQTPVAPWAKLNLAAIAPYPLIMVAIVATGLVDTTAGLVLLLLDGAIVGLIAVAHWAGLRPTADEPHPVAA